MRKILITLTSLFWVMSVNAQNLYNVNGTLSISENGVLSVSQSFVNEGTVINNGRLVIGQDWQNDGTYSSDSEGDIVLNGEEEQYINHNAQTFNNVTISGGDKIFEADLTIEGEIDFSDGKLFSENGARLIVGPNAIVSGGSETSYVVGSLYISSGSNRFYPVGTEELYLPVTLSEVEDTEAIIGVIAHEGQASTILDNTISAISPDYYWETDLIEGTTSEAKVRLEFRNANFIGDVSNITIAETDDLANQFEDQAWGSRGGDPGEGFVVSRESLVGPYFTIARLFGIEDRPPVNVLNLLTPNGDGWNDFLEIENITAYPEGVVTIFNRVGNKLYEVVGYDNDEIRFTGVSNQGNTQELAEGTYFYVITENGKELASGFFEIIR